MKRAVSLLIVLLLGAAAVLWWRRPSDAEAAGYRFAEVERGDLEAVVSATGNLEAVTTVQVGTQVSGIISEIFVDFNDRVQAGQVIARIDPTLLTIAVRDAEAGLKRARAESEHTRTELDRIRALGERNLASEAELNLAQYQADVATASEASARINLERARQNLDYATIHAPVSGTVIERNVEVGQTVAASLSAPQLFLLANDLAKMRIVANVDESDIGRIHEGQLARFTVQAYPDDTFEGRVAQVRLQSTVVENVVTYAVVVDVANPDGRLLPGMTATVDFVVDHAEDVLMVANAALRFRPSAEAFEKLRAQRAAMRAGADSTRSGRTEGAAAPAAGATDGSGTDSARGGSPGRGHRSSAMLWSVDANGELTATPVRVGITDGRMTQVEGRDLEAGLPVVIGITQGGATASSNPFQSNSGGRRPPP
ncbi:MAG: efflux RND transporter periplasmic adaptor subunit, partial [Gemmatimonadetes bacterium]|nr:efflux RND transporter periplasmic adaptor subunit [Gemmatimonadota bacterium]